MSSFRGIGRVVKINTNVPHRWRLAIVNFFFSVCIRKKQQQLVKYPS